MRSPSRLLPCSCRMIAAAFDFGLHQFLIGLGVTHVRSVFVSSHRSVDLGLLGRSP